MIPPSLSRFALVARRAALWVAATATLAAAQATTSAPPAPNPAPTTAADSAIRIVLLTMGQGDDVWELFGHNAIWVHDPARAREDTVYNWGVFDFRTQGFYGRFLRGDMRYRMDGESIGNTLAIYQYYNRRVWAQELDLTPAEKRDLVEFIRWNVRPENSQYRYDYYRDNCSTRVRDAIDRVLGGRLREHLRGIPTDQTYRSHSLRMMQGAPLLVTGVEVALGRGTDFKLTVDEAAFLPVQLMNAVRGFTLDGGIRPLVKREFMLVDADRAPEPTTVPSLWKGLLPIGLGLAALLLGLLYAAHAPRATAVVAAIVAGVMGLVGTIILLLATVTDHVAAHSNENMFLLNPVWLAVAVMLPMLLWRGRAVRATRWTALVAAALGACAVLFHLVGLSRQPNWDVIGLLLPAQLAMAAIALRYRRPVNSAGRAKNST